MTHGSKVCKKARPLAAPIATLSLLSQERGRVELPGRCRNKTNTLGVLCICILWNNNKRKVEKKDKENKHVRNIVHLHFNVSIIKER
jgi:hypothetical protein